MTGRPPAPELPRLVEQLRILLWMQMHLTVLGFLAAVLLVGFVSNYRDGALPRETEDWLMLTMGLQLVAAVLLATCAALLRRRRWKVVHLLALAAEAMVIAIVVRAFAQAFIGLLTQTGLFTWVLMPIYAALTGWILVDLFRGEVLRHLWRRGTAPAAAPRGAAR
jgi:hypothetical protein